MNKVNLFVDSGAFSVWKRNIEVDINEYIDFIKRNEKYIEVYSCLDVIGDAEGTYKNQKIMEKAGLKPLITYHIGEDFEWFKKYAKEYDYVALGGLATGSKINELVGHLDRCFGHICGGKDNMPSIKIHGFGVAQPFLLLRYPWYSADSAAWVISSRTGVIYVPQFINGKYDYLVAPYKIKTGHINSFGKDTQQIIKNYLDSAKMSIENVINDYRFRDRINILFYKNMEKAISWPRPFKSKYRGFFL